MDKESPQYKKAREFADAAYAAAMNQLSAEYQKDRGELRNRMAASGNLISGAMSRGSAELIAKHIERLLQARLDGLLEGYEMHGVLLDEGLAAETLREIIDLRDLKLKQASQSLSKADSGPMAPQIVGQMVVSECHFSPASVKVQIERRRHKTAKERAAVTNIYHLHGDNSRVNVNSTDNSTNVVNVSPIELFAALREKIVQDFTDQQKQQEVLETLRSLEEAQDAPSAWSRYTAFIGVLADHITIYSAFLPALTEFASRHIR